MFFNGRAKVKGFVGLSLGPNRISIARIVSDYAQRPKLELLDTVRFASESEQADILAGLVKKNRLANASCCVVIEPGSYNLLQVEAPEVAQDELKSALRWQIRDMVDFSLDNAVIDVFEMPEQHNPARGRPKHVNAVVAHAPKIDVLVERVKSSGLKLKAIDITELALRNIASLLLDDDDGVALLHLAEKRSLINLTQHASLYQTRGLGINMLSLRSIEESLAGDADISFEDNRRLDDLVLEIQRSLGYYESYYGLPPIPSLVVAPTSPELPSFIHYLSIHLGIPVRTFDLNMMLEAEEPIDLAKQVDGLLAVGAALRDQNEDV